MISAETQPTPQVRENGPAASPLPGAETSGADSTPAPDTALASRLIALQALGEQRMKLDADLRALYRKRDLIDAQIGIWQQGVGLVECDGFIIKPRRQVKRAYGHQSPSERRKARMQSAFSVEAA